jgi:surface protein
MIDKISQLKQLEGIIDVSQYSGDMALWYAVRIATFNPNIINTSTMTSMIGMFGSWPFTDTLDFHGFDTSSATNMEGMFRGNKASALTNLTDFDTSKVTNMRELFSGCDNLTSLDLSGWDVSKVTLTDYAFNNCKSLQSIDLSGWVTSAVTDMTNMFAYMRNAGGKIWVPSTFSRGSIQRESQAPFSAAPCSQQYSPFDYWHIYTDVADATTAQQRWGPIHSNFIVHYNSTHQDFINA